MIMLGGGHDLGKSSDSGDGDGNGIRDLDRGLHRRVRGAGVIAGGAESSYDFDVSSPLELLEPISGTASQATPLVGHSLLEGAVGPSSAYAVEIEPPEIEPAELKPTELEPAEVGQVTSWPAKIWIPALLGLSLASAWLVPMPTLKAKGPHHWHGDHGFFGRPPRAHVSSSHFEIEHEGTSTWREFYGDDMRATPREIGAM